MPNLNLPTARNANFLTEELDDELLVFDQDRDLACRLNRTAALVWRHADGTQTIDDLVALLRAELGDIADEDLVLVTLDRLHEQGLLQDGYEGRDPDASRLSRRRFIRRVGVVGSAALALPVVQSVIAPALAAAASSTCDACTCPCGCSSCIPCGTCGAGYCQPTNGCYCGATCAPCGGSAGTVTGAATRWRR